MKSRAAKAAAVALAAAKASAPKRTIAANDERARALAEQRKLARAAATWAFENDVGTRRALKTEQFKDSGLTVNMVQPLLAELKAGGVKKRLDAPRDIPCQVLTNDERCKLAEWMLACAAGQNPKDRAAISAKVKDMLRARHAANKRRNWRGGSIRLNDQEVAVVQSREPLSKSFFERFFPWCRAHGIAIEEGVERSQDKKRAVKMQAPPAGLQPRCGAAGGSHRGCVRIVSYLGSWCARLHEIVCTPRDTRVYMGVIGVVRGWGG